jgi:hypothetical protein
MSDIVYRVSGGKATVQCLRCGATAEGEIHLGEVGDLCLYHEDGCPVLAQDSSYRFRRGSLGGPEMKA